MAAAGETTGKMTPQHRTRVLASLEDLQAQHDRIIAEMRRARRLIAERARDLVAPLLDARRNLIAGTANAVEADAVARDAKAATLAGFAVPAPEPSAEAGEAEAEAEAAPAAASDAEDTARAPFDAFWITVLAQHPLWAEMIEERDEDALGFLVDCRVRMHDDWTGFALDWHFRENPFFTNEVLTKTITFSGQVDADSDLSVKSITGTDIKWRAGKQLTLRKPKRRSKGGRGGRRGRRAPEPEPEDDPSVFCYFERELDPAALMAKGLDEDALEELHEQVSMDIQAAEVLRESLAPRAVKWFLGEEGADSDDDEDGTGAYFEAEAGDEEEEEEAADGEADADADTEAMRSALAAAFGSAGGGETGDQGSAPAANPFAGGGNPFAPGPSGGEGGSNKGEENPECKQQ